MTVSVLLADDQALVRAGLRLVLEGAGGFTVCGEASDGAGAVAQARVLRPDVVVMDVRMPVMDGIEATRALAGPGVAEPVPVLMLTTYDVDEHVFAALRAGASGFLLKHDPPERLIDGVRQVAAGEGLIAPRLTRRLIAAFAAAPATPAAPGELTLLTDRERAVLDLLVRGRSNAEIATALFVESSTVKSHVGNVLAKLGLRDRVQAVIYGYEHGLVVAGAEATDT